MMESGQNILPTDPQDRRDVKILLTVGIHAGWPKNLAGFQGPFLTSLQALSDPKEDNIVGPWVWGVSKSYTGNGCPSQYCVCAASTHM